MSAHLLARLRAPLRVQGNQLPWSGSLIFFVVECFRFVYLRRLPDRELVQYIPDDAFYYFALAKNFSLLHR